MLNEGDVLVFRSLTYNETGVEYVEIESIVHARRIHGSFRFKDHKVIIGREDTNPLLYIETWLREEDIGKIKGSNGRVWSYHRKDELWKVHREALQLALHRFIGDQVELLQKAMREISEWRGP